MRFRRETGDFLIKGTATPILDEETGEQTGVSTTFNTVRPGLSLEDLMGEMVAYYIDGELIGIEVVDSVRAGDDSNILALNTSGNAHLRYNRTTGAISEVNTPGPGEVIPRDPVTPIDQGASEGE